MAQPQAMLINMGGRGNIGDRAMALNVIRQLREGSPEARLLVGPHTLDFMVEEFDLQRYPYLSHCFSRWGAVEQRLGTKARWLKPLQYLFYCLDSLLVLLLIMLKRLFNWDPGWRFMEAELARAISTSQVVFFCGGGYITDVGRLEARSNLVMAWFATLAGKPVIMSGQGFGPFDSWLSRFLVKLVVPRLDTITFRDVEGSEQLLQQLGVEIGQGKAVGDDAMSLPERQVEQTGQTDAPVKLGVNFRISPFTPNLEQRVEAFTRFLSLASNQLGWQIHFYIFETWRPWEEGLVDSIITDGELKDVVIHKTEDPREALYLTRQCDVAIGISYHFIVFALKLGIPVLALFTGEYYRAKMSGLLAWYGKGDWVVPVQQMEAEALLSQCQVMLEQREQTRQPLVDKTVEMAKNSRVTIDRALHFLNAGQR
ncbi:polysaccharide pyruvyl transferase family protein [Motiliproteus sp.]|uniref:polysaccharide pyruvyl transferase family protein n=1 Tax=Motiliproteus sp. TaxID=1898955 RepID=UPI003BAC5547